VIDPASELVLIDNALNFAGNHNGGDVRFGTDGYLYASIGDGGCEGANGASRDRNILNGKIVRIAKDGSLSLETIAFCPGVTRANNAILGLFGTPAGNVTVASGFAMGTADLVIDVTGCWR
jgi:Glucose / Sorbosone dehydrogenase